MTRLDPSGASLVFSTYLGGGSYDSAAGVALDQAGNVLVTGSSLSSDFPLQRPVQAANAGGADAFLAELDGSGTALLFSTYLGGAGHDSGVTVAAGQRGSVYLAGDTSSIDLPTARSAQPDFGGGSDAFVAQVVPSTSTLRSSTYLGGTGFDIAQGLAVGPAGQIWLAGLTRSTDFPSVQPLKPTNNGDGDAFVAQLDVNLGSILLSTYLGGVGFDAANGIAVDSSGRVVVAGGTSSADFPTTAPLQPVLAGTFDSFITRLTSSECKPGIGRGDPKGCHRGPRGQPAGKRQE